MNKKKLRKILIGVLCVALVVFAAVVALFLDSQSPDPIIGIFQTDPADTPPGPQDSASDTIPSSPETTPSSPAETLPAPPEDLPPSVVIPPSKNPQTGEVIGISFP